MVDARGGEVAQRGNACRGGDGVAVERAGVEDLAAAGVEQTHQVGAAAHCAHRVATADDLAHRGEIGGDAEVGLVAAFAHAQRDDLVEHEHRTGAVRGVDDPLEELGGRGDEARRAHRTLEEHRSDLVALLGQDLLERRSVAPRRGDGVRPVLVALVAERAGLERLVAAVVPERGHQHLVPAGVGARHVQREHVGLGAGVAEADEIDRRDAGTDQSRPARSACCCAPARRCPAPMTRLTASTMGV